MHAAVRLVVPLIPALAASSPIAAGRQKPFLDYRLEMYRTNAATMPSITGRVVTETVSSEQAYRLDVLAPMYRQIAPHDPHGVLQHEWLNSRGAIARFDRNAIEIRLCDTQECPRADPAIAAAIVAVVRSLYQSDRLLSIETTALEHILLATIRDADRAVLSDAVYLDLLGIDATALPAGVAWSCLIDRCRQEIRSLDAGAPPMLDAIVRHGPLARRIVAATGELPDRNRLAEVYRRLCTCLANDDLFEDLPAA